MRFTNLSDVTDDQTIFSGLKESSYVFDDNDDEGYFIDHLTFRADFDALEVKQYSFLFTVPSSLEFYLNKLLVSSY